MTWIYWIGWNLFRSFYRGLFKLKVTGMEHLVREGPVLVVANHESFIDPPLIGTLYQDDMYYLARKSLMSTPALKWIYKAWNSIPVDQDRPDMSGIKAIVKLLKDGNRVLVFPEGERTESGELGVAQPGTGLVVAKSGTLVQPIRIRGAREALPRGSGRVRFARVSLNIGPPIRFTPEELAAAHGKEGYQKIADRLMEAIAAL